MPLWTNGSAHVVATGWGVARCEGAKNEVSRFSLEGLRRDQDPPALEVFAILDPEGRRALLRRHSEKPALWTAGSGFEPVDGPELLDAVSLGEGAVLAAVAEKDRCVLRRASVDGSVALGEPIALTPTGRLSWTSSLWKKGEETWPEGDPDGRVRLVANRCGIAFTSSSSGLVALLDRESLKPKICVRAPVAPDDFAIFGLPVPQGLLLTLVSSSRSTEYVLVDEKGEVAAQRNKVGKELAAGASSAGVLWSDDKVVVNQQATGGATYYLALPGLTSKQFSKEDAIIIDATSTEDGSRHLLALTNPSNPKPQSWKLLQYDPTAKKLKGEAKTMPDFKPPPPPVAKPEKRKRSEGSPVLAMKPDTSTPWRANVSETAALRIQVMNRGGPLAGMYVELGGNAVSDGVVAAEEATLGGAQGRFEKRGSSFRVEISEAKLDAHFADATRADPAPSIDLVVKVRAERAGNGLMTVRVGPIGATGTTGSAMEGRSFIAS